MSQKIRFEIDGPVAVITVCRPEVRNAVDDETARQLVASFELFDADETLSAAVLTGEGGNFCAGADLKAVANGERRAIQEEGIAPMGPTRMMLSKPVIAAVEGYAVAGGLELALWCDLRVAARDAVFGVFCRRFGVPLIDLGTIRLPRLIGQSRAMDMILTGRAVGAEEALAFGLANRVVEAGTARSAAIALAKEIVAFPQLCLRADRQSALEQWSLDWDAACRNEFRKGMTVIASGETRSGATRFAHGAGRHGEIEN